MRPNIGANLHMHSCILCILIFFSLSTLAYLLSASLENDWQLVFSQWQSPKPLHPKNLLKSTVLVRQGWSEALGFCKSMVHEPLALNHKYQVQLYNISST